MAFEKGVSFYTKGTATFDVYFPEDKADCAHCQFCFLPQNDDLKRHKCSLTGEFLYAPAIGRGRECPITVKNEKE